MKRESGILMPVFSLASRFGIGCLSKEAYDFVDFLERSAQGYWQILPVGPTGFGNSPYQPFSAFAGNPYFISLDALIEEGLLREEEAAGLDFGGDAEKVDYGAMYENRKKALQAAFARFKEQGDKAREGELSFEKYKEKEDFWLSDYALYVAIKEENQGASWLDWEDGLRLREASAMKAAKERLADEIEYVCFVQYKFDQQWRRLHKYAKTKQVKIIGDLPLYVAMDSADSWSHPEVFCFDKEKKPTMVTGCPPDAFSPTGQLWGNPAYDWEAQEKEDFSWWVHRIARNYEWYDVIRLDHFHGFSDFYGIKYGEETAEHGKSYPGPGMKLFKALEKELGELHMIAEDLGTNTPENQKLLAESGFPGMNVLQYAFTSWDSIYVNHRHNKNSVVYTGTHDNTPTFAWAQEINEGQMGFARRYINSKEESTGGFVWDMIREAYRSVADLCVIPLQDYLCKGKEARINTPGGADGNWEWRLLPNFLSEDLSRSIRELAETYGRVPEKSSEA